jgi:hypothetical protein
MEIPHLLIIKERYLFPYLKIYDSMLGDQDDISFVIVNDEIRFRCNVCSTLLKHPTGWFKHRKSKKHQKAENGN